MSEGKSIWISDECANNHHNRCEYWDCPCKCPHHEIKGEKKEDRDAGK